MSITLRAGLLILGGDYAVSLKSNARACSICTAQFTQIIITKTSHYCVGKHLLFKKRGEYIKSVWCSTRSPFVTLLSRRAQSGRRNSYQETGVVHRIT